MNTFIKRPAGEREEIFYQTAQHLNMEPAAVEKDFWVCWVLRELFRSPLAHSVIFKGGTCLSKVYGLIDRFSEDIDLILNWSGAEIVKEWQSSDGKVGRKKVMEALDEWNVIQVAGTILPTVQQFCGELCSASVPEKTPEVVLINYPRIFESAYIRPEIKLEIGPKAAWDPNEAHVIKPYIAEQYPHLLNDAEVEVRATSAERAFWEKVTILHAQAQRSSELPKRYARHYYDVVMMARNTVLKQRAYADVELLYRVASFKHYFYRAGWADYPNAKPGSMHLMPAGHIMEDLQLDYASMKGEMLPTDAPSLESILSELKTIEAEVNALQPLPLDIRNYPDMQP